MNATTTAKTTTTPARPPREFRPSADLIAQAKREAERTGAGSGSGSDSSASPYAAALGYLQGHYDALREEYRRTCERLARLEEKGR